MAGRVEKMRYLKDDLSEKSVQFLVIDFIEELEKLANMILNLWFFATEGKLTPLEM